MRLRELREEYDYKQDVLAKCLGVKQHTYSQYETGKRQIPVEALIKLAKLYNVSVDYILELTDIEDPYPQNKTTK